MGKNFLIRFLTGIIILFTSLVPSSCERLENVSIEEFNCFNCYQTKPEWVQLNVTLTLNGQNPSVPLTIYIGDFEDNNIDWVDTAYASSYWVDVKPDRYYSVKAEYKDGSATVYAIDGDKIKLRKNSTDCDAPCYYQVGGYIDVRLR
jgi:hypothetical protein